MKQCNVEIIAVGNEILNEGHRDSNSDCIAGWAFRNGLVIKFRSIVGDNPEDLVNTIQTSAGRVDLIIMTGGLGPTWDDITRTAISKAFSLELELNPDAEKQVKKSLGSRGITPDSGELVQAWLPKGGTCIPNPSGIAPGIHIKAGSVILAAFPGVPHELQTMLETMPLEMLVPGDFEPLYERTLTLKIIGKREREVERLLGDTVKQPEVVFSILPGSRWIELVLKRRGKDMRQMEKQLHDLEIRIRDMLKHDVFSSGDENLEQVTASLLLRSGVTISTVESCTGGLLAYRLTSVSGSSGYFHQGAITYSNEAKKKVLAVSAATLEKHGAVSAQTAEEMAKGIRKITGTDIGVSITGIAGPTGGTSGKPVGTVYFGMDTANGYLSRHRIIPGNRELIRVRAADTALDMVRRYLLQILEESNE